MLRSVAVMKLRGAPEAPISIPGLPGASDAAQYATVEYANVESHSGEPSQEPSPIIAPTSSSPRR